VVTRERRRDVNRKTADKKGKRRLEKGKWVDEKPGFVYSKGRTEGEIIIPLQGRGKEGCIVNAPEGVGSTTVQ